MSLTINRLSLIRAAPGEARRYSNQLIVRRLSTAFAAIPSAQIYRKQEKLYLKKRKMW